MSGHGADASWLCCQLGAREHYAVPRALNQAGALAALVTDIWNEPRHVTHRLYPRRLRERFHPQLEGASVRAFNLPACLFEARHLLTGPKGWELIARRNDWFQDQALRVLSRQAQRNPGKKYRLFSFSYTARRLFEFAKSMGWTTVLGQIDPGPAEERIVLALHRESATAGAPWRPAPRSYWADWRQEWRLADTVVVNSSWSHQALLGEGVPDEKIRTVPLAYEAPEAAAGFRRSYPTTFSPGRPLRVLFLGQIGLRKGIAAVLEAMAQLQRDPVEFWFVGPRQIGLPPRLPGPPHARWVGSVPRADVDRYYKDADVFLFPTFSDGFGLTQLEAQAWRLPVVASRFCGDVVRDGVNGVLLPEVSGDAIAEALRSFLVDPGRLGSMSGSSASLAEFGIRQLGSRLLQAIPPG